jgi:hypothetical protein
MDGIDAEVRAILSVMQVAFDDISSVYSGEPYLYRNFISSLLQCQSRSS